jgi:hypothetical protein
MRCSSMVCINLHYGTVMLRRVNFGDLQAFYVSLLPTDEFIYIPAAKISVNFDNLCEKSEKITADSTCVEHNALQCPTLATHSPFLTNQHICLPFGAKPIRMR